MAFFTKLDDKPFKPYRFLLIISALILLLGCDYISPKKSFILAIPNNDYSYSYSARHLKHVLEKGGFTIKIVHTENAIEANDMVANGKADLTFVMDHSTFIPESIGDKAGKLRTIAPLFQRLFFLFSKSEVGELDGQAQLSKKKIGIEVLNGETHQNLTILLASTRINDVQIVDWEYAPDIIHFWGTI